MTHSPEHGRGIPPLVARTDREPAPSPQEIKDAFDEAKADIEAAKLEGVPPRISPSAQRVLDHAAADSVREQIHALLGTRSEAHGHGGDHGHEAGHGNGHDSHGAGGSHDSHGGHDAHGHGHKTPPKGGNLGTRVLGDAAGVASAGAIGASGVFGWLWKNTFGRIKAYGDENAPDALKAVFGDKGAEGGKKKKGGGHGHGHDDHGGGHH